jgi:hypothetical protein
LRPQLRLSFNRHESKVIARTMDAFLSCLQSRPSREIVHASGSKRERRAKVARLDPPRRSKIVEGVDSLGKRLRRGAVVRDARAIDCTFDGATDPSAFTTFERVELVRPIAATRNVMNEICRNVVIERCERGAKVLSLVNVLCDRVRLVGDFMTGSRASRCAIRNPFSFTSAATRRPLRARP